MPAATPVEVLDGRQSRTARSRRAICDACLDLVHVSRRSIFNHFADLAELYDAVVEAGTQRCAPLLEDISDQQPVERRVERLIQVRSKFLEATAAFTRALTAQALVGPAADQALRVSTDALGRQYADIERLFGRELAHLSSADRVEVLEAMSAAMAPPLWEHLRRNRGLSISRSRALVKRTLTSILRNADVEA
jgi:AcrR family transcriptional regulator